MSPLLPFSFTLKFPPSTRVLFSAGLALAAVCLAGSPAHAQYTFTTINDSAAPYFSSTTATGISNNGQIIGTYGGHGFVDTNGAFATADFSGGSSETFPAGINTSGQIVGDYVDASGYFSSYIETGGVYSSLQDPNGYFDSTSLTGINDKGQIVGTYTAPSDGQFGIGKSFVDTGGVFTDFSVPGVFATHPTSINNAGQIAGYTEGIYGGEQGFVDTGGIIETVSVPNAAQTTVTGINDAGQIVGTYTDAARNQHGFVKIGNTFLTVDDPNAASGPFTYNTLRSSLTGINDAGQIVGTYFDANGVQHGFEAAPVPEASTIVSFALLLGLGGAVIAVRKKRAA